MGCGSTARGFQGSQENDGWAGWRSFHVFDRWSCEATRSCTLVQRQAVHQRCKLLMDRISGTRTFLVSSRVSADPDTQQSKIHFLWGISNTLSTLVGNRRVTARQTVSTRSPDRGSPAAVQPQRYEAWSALPRPCEVEFLGGDRFIIRKQVSKSART
jgi:hypothetical protein